MQFFLGVGGGWEEARISVDQCLGAMDLESTEMPALPTRGPEKDTKPPNNPFKGTFQVERNVDCLNVLPYLCSKSIF